MLETRKIDRKLLVILIVSLLYIGMIMHTKEPPDSIEENSESYSGVLKDTSEHSIEYISESNSGILQDTSEDSKENTSESNSEVLQVTNQNSNEFSNESMSVASEDISKDSKLYLKQECYTYSNITATNKCCKSHQYTASDFQHCAAQILNSKPKGSSSPPKRMYWALVGDSRIRQIFTSIAYLLKDTQVRYHYVDGKTKETKTGLIPEVLDILFAERIGIPRWDLELNGEDPPLLIKFHWDPFLSKLPVVLKGWLRQPDAAPTFLLTDTGLHYMLKMLKVYLGKGQLEASKPFNRKVQELIPDLSELGKDTYTVFQTIDPVLFQYNWKTLTKVESRENIEYYDKILSNLIPKDGNLVYWDSTYPLANQYVEKCYPEEKKTDDHFWNCADNTHIGYIGIHQYRNMLMNYVCNRHMSLNEEYCI